MTSPETLRPRSWARAALVTPGGIVGGIIVLALILAAAFAPVFLSEQATTIDAANARLAPSPEHLFGTDDLGRDILARILVATRLTLALSLGAVAIGTVLGVGLGVLAATLGSAARQTLYQLTSAATAFPGILLALLLATLLGRSGIAAMIGLGLAGIPGAARLTLNITSSVAGGEFVSAARVVGVPHWRIVRRYIVPHVMEPLATLTIVSLGSALLVMSALSFLGIGVQPPQFDWGQMLNESRPNVYTAPMATIAPGIAIVIAGIGFSLFGEAFAGNIDPRSRLMVTGGGPRRGGTRKVETPSVAAVPADSILEITDLRVTASQQGIELVHGVSVGVRPGERVGIVGESGSGKSLTLGALGAQTVHGLHLSTGSHTFHGADLRRLSPRAKRKLIGSKIAMVFQDPMSSLNPALTIGSQLDDKLRAHSRMSRRERRRRILAALTEVQIPEPQRRMSQHPHELSGGQRQRVMIAMALLGDAEVILADECTTALDVSVQAQIVDLLLELNRTRGTALVFVSHDLALVSQVAERIVVMVDGRIVEQGTTEQVIGAPVHPYTAALLGAVPDLTRGTTAPLTTIGERSWDAVAGNAAPVTPAKELV